MKRWSVFPALISPPRGSPWNWRAASSVSRLDWSVALQGWLQPTRDVFIKSFFYKLLIWRSMFGSMSLCWFSSDFTNVLVRCHHCCSCTSTWCFEQKTSSSARIHFCIGNSPDRFTIVLFYNVCAKAYFFFFLCLWFVDGPYGFTV